MRTATTRFWPIENWRTHRFRYVVPLRQRLRLRLWALGMSLRQAMRQMRCRKRVVSPTHFAQDYLLLDGFSAFGGPLVRDNQVDTKELVRFVQNRLADWKYQQKPQLACATPKLFLL